MNHVNFAVVVPMANEENRFAIFIERLSEVLNSFNQCKVYLVVDENSRDNTFPLCKQLSISDPRFQTIYEPGNKNVVDAYIRGYREAFNNGHKFIIEMDAGLSHNPELIPFFLKKLNEGYECVFGSRFMKGGSMTDSPFSRVFLSRFGTFVSNILLGTKLYDMTSGYQGFHRNTVEKILQYNLLSTGHFYQTELRYLLRKRKYIEIPIHYKSTSDGVSNNSIKNSVNVLSYYFLKRLTGKSLSL